MKTVCIVAEFNPFHAGHKYLFEKARELGARNIVVIMSGNFVQRGEPALTPLEYRVRHALEAGADLVARLPLGWALSSARGFARGGTAIARAVGDADALVFGSECGDTELIRRAARVSEMLDSGMDVGRKDLSYPALFSEEAAKLDPEAARVFDGANDTLGVEYVRALDGALEPVSVRRLDGVSATRLRGEIRAGILNYDEPVYNEERFGLCLLAALRGLSREELEGLPDGAGGVGSAIFAASRTAGSLAELIESAKNKSCTAARIKRVCLRAMLGLKLDYSVVDPPYFNVLGFNADGAELLKNVSLPVVCGYRDAAALEGFARDQYELECRAADIYGLFFEKPFPCGSEERRKVIRL